MNKQTIINNCKRYPKARISDIVKLVYQNEFGGGHFVASEDISLSRLEIEMQKISKDDVNVKTFSNLPLFEDIGNNFCRINLRKVADTNLSYTTLNRFFIVSSNKRIGSISSFAEKLSNLVDMCNAHQIPYSAQDMQKYIDSYRDKGYPPLSHSEIYVNEYNPAYRVINLAYKKYFRLFDAIDNLLVNTTKNIFVTIDGGSCSGKSRLGEMLNEIYDCNLFHADDFFLTPEQRMPFRLAEPGGNIDYERMESEIFSKIEGNREFTYRHFDCSSMQFTRKTVVSPKKLNIVEGSYSSHPLFKKYRDLSVFLKVSPKTQAERVLARNGPIIAERFKSEWIPKEKIYFKTYKIEKTSDLVFEE